MSNSNRYPYREEQTPVLRISPKLIICTVAVVVAAVVAAVFLIARNYVDVDGHRVRVDSTTLDLRGCELTSLEGLEKCEALESVDLRDNPLTLEQIEWLAGQLPDCSIQWSILVGGVLVDNSSTQLDLSGRNVTSLAGLDQIDELTYIDIRDNPLDPEEVSRFIASMPDCEVLWNVYAAGFYFDRDVTGIDLKDAGVTDISNLRYLSQLADLDLRGNELDPSAVIELMEQLPDCEVLWSIPIAGQRYDSSVDSLTLGNASDEEVRLLQYFPKLTRVDASGCTAYDALDAMAVSLPGCAIEWNITIGGKQYSVTGTTKLTLKEALTDEELAMLPYLRKLTSVDVDNTAIIDQLVPAIKKMDWCKFLYEVELTEHYTCSSTRETLNMRKAQINDYESFKTKLGYLPNLKHITLDYCNLTNEQLDGIRQAYPYLTVRWVVKFGGYRVPTDTHVFSTLQASNTSRRFTDEELGVLRYCTELRCLDLGHNNLTNLDFVEPLTKLQAIIITDNRNLSDISGLAGKQDLQYIEMLTTKVNDLSPLGTLPSLTDLHIYNTPAWETPTYDLSVLHSVSTLEHFVGHDNTPHEQLIALKEAIPGCLVHGVDQNASSEWSNSARRAVYRKVFKKWSEVEYFNNYDDFKM